MSKLSIESIIRPLMHGYVQGSCVSETEALNVIEEELVANGHNLHEGVIEDLFWQTAEDMEIFRCVNCGWWCPAFERADNQIEEVCRDCEPDLEGEIDEQDNEGEDYE